MRTLTLVLLLTAAAAGADPANAQDAAPADAQDNASQDAARIESAEVSGLSLDALSPGLRREIDGLAGAPQDDERIDRLARRIEEEHPDVVAAVRTVARPDNQLRIIFLVARIGDSTDLVSNINSRYTVESIEINGIPDDEVSGRLRAQLQALVGAPLDHDEAERLVEELEEEHPRYRVQRRIARGIERGRIRVVFEFDEREDDRRWLPFAPSRSKFVYHSDQGPSGVLDIPMGSSRHRALLGFAIKNDDDLIEEYSGIRFGVESRRLGTDRLGARIEVSRLRNEWEAETLAALETDASIPGAYRHRLTIDPSVTVALSPRVWASFGASLSELESLADATATQMASAFVASVGYRQDWGRRRDGHTLDASYEFRSAAGTLESDLIYKRHLGKARYRNDQGDGTLIVDVMAGGLTGTAPLFERFTLGDTSTLRGWNKFDLAPAGGTRVFHQSLEYRLHHVGFFIDSGSVWTSGRDELKVRFGAGVGLHGDNGFLTLAFPLNAGDVGATFMAGVRF
jgi:hypothetical protein